MVKNAADVMKQRNVGSFLGHSKQSVREQTAKHLRTGGWQVINKHCIRKTHTGAHVAADTHHEEIIHTNTEACGIRWPQVGQSHTHRTNNHAAFILRGRKCCF